MHVFYNEGVDSVGGDSLQEAFEQCILGMFGYPSCSYLLIHRYMTDMEHVGINLEETPIVVKATGYHCYFSS